MNSKDIISKFPEKKYPGTEKLPDHPIVSAYIDRGGFISTDSSMMLVCMNSENELTINDNYLYSESLEDFFKNTAALKGRDFVSDFDKNHYYVEVRKKYDSNKSFEYAKHYYLVFGKDEEYVEEIKKHLDDYIDKMLKIDKTLIKVIVDSVIDGKKVNSGDESGSCM